MLLVIILRYINASSVIDGNIRNFKMISIKKDMMLISDINYKVTVDHCKTVEQVFIDNPQLVIVCPIVDHPANKIPAFARSQDDRRKMTRGFTINKIKNIFLMKNYKQLPDYLETPIFMKLSDVQINAFACVDDNSFDFESVEDSFGPIILQLGEVEAPATPTVKVIRTPRNNRIAAPATFSIVASDRSSSELNSIDYLAVKAASIRQDRRPILHKPSPKVQERVLNTLKHVAIYLRGLHMIDVRKKHAIDLEKMRLAEIASVGRMASVASSRMTRRHVSKQVVRRDAVYGLQPPVLSKLKYFDEKLRKKQAYGGSSKDLGLNNQPMTLIVKRSIKLDEGSQKSKNFIEFLRKSDRIGTHRITTTRIRERSPLRKSSDLVHSRGQITSRTAIKPTYAALISSKLCSHKPSEIIETSNSSSSNTLDIDDQASVLKSNAGGATLSIFKKVIESLSHKKQQSKMEQESDPSRTSEIDQAAACESILKASNRMASMDRRLSCTSLMSKSIVQKMNEAMGQSIRASVEVEDDQNGRHKSERVAPMVAEQTTKRDFKRVGNKIVGKRMLRSNSGVSEKRSQDENKSYMLRRQATKEISRSRIESGQNVSIVHEQDIEESPNLCIKRNDQGLKIFEIGIHPVQSGSLLDVNIVKPKSKMISISNDSKKYSIEDYDKSQILKATGNLKKTEIKGFRSYYLNRHFKSSVNILKNAPSKPIKNIAWSQEDTEQLGDFKQMIKKKIASSTPYNSALNRPFAKSTFTAQKKTPEVLSLFKKVAISPHRRNQSSSSKERKFLLDTGLLDNIAEVQIEKTSPGSCKNKSIGYDYIFDTFQFNRSLEGSQLLKKRIPQGQTRQKNYKIDMGKCSDDDHLAIGKSLSKSGSNDEREIASIRKRKASRASPVRVSKLSSPLMAGSSVSVSKRKSGANEFSPGQGSIGNFIVSMNESHKRLGEVSSHKNQSEKESLSRKVSPMNSISKESPREPQKKPFHLTLNKVKGAIRATLRSKIIPQNVNDSLEEKGLITSDKKDDSLVIKVVSKTDEEIAGEKKRKRLDDLAAIGLLAPTYRASENVNKIKSRNSLEGSDSEYDSRSEEHINHIPTSNRVRELQRKRMKLRAAKFRLKRTRENKVKNVRLPQSPSLTNQKKAGFIITMAD